METNEETRARIDRVMKLVSGWESAYSLELLASVHWLVSEDPALSAHPDKLVDRLHSWTARKQRLFPATHVSTALEALTDRGWVQTPAAV